MPRVVFCVSRLWSPGALTDEEIGMSSNGTRKETRGWAINGAPGQLINIETDDVPIEEVVADSGGRQSSVATPRGWRRTSRGAGGGARWKPSTTSCPCWIVLSRTTWSTSTRRRRGLASKASRRSRASFWGWGSAGGLVLSRRHAVAQPSAQDSQQAASQKEPARQWRPWRQRNPFSPRRWRRLPRPKRLFPRRSSSRGRRRRLSDGRRSGAGSHARRVGQGQGEGGARQAIAICERQERASPRFQQADRFREALQLAPQLSARRLP